MLAPTVFAVLLLCLSPASAIGEIPPSNSGEEPIDLYKCDFRQDPHYGQLLAFARRGLPKEMFFGAGMQVPEYVFVQRQDPAEIMGVRAICYGDHMAPVVPSGPVAEWRDLICPVPGAPFDGKSFPTCKVRNLVIKAQLRVEQLGFDNSKTDRTETVDKTFTTNFVIKGEVTMAPTFFKVFGLEATASGEYSKQAIIKTTTVKGVKAGYSATYVSAFVDLRVTMDYISLSQYLIDKTAQTRTCIPDKFELKAPVTNDFVVGEQKAWLNCTAVKEEAPKEGGVTKRQEQTPTQRTCYGITATEELVEEPCFTD
ncbi:hypothetical protein F5H01DRAFT_339096 [Linnemannia elongata]|nr:hypothetical protein F5H01DRAFT_339096 [Linnemannia elongata]